MINRETSTEMTAQAEEYLESILRRQERGEAATPTELARELGVAPPSVVGMLRRLAEHGLVDYPPRAGATLTPRGAEAALALRRRHRLAERLLTDILGIPWERAHVIACRFEHVIDDEVEGYLRAALADPETCPHGNPIDGAPNGAFQPLTALPVGASAHVRCMTDESAPLLDYLGEMRLKPGARVTVRAVAPQHGPLTVEVDGERVALSHAMAVTVLVECDEVAE